MVLDGAALTAGDYSESINYEVLKSRAITAKSIRLIKYGIWAYFLLLIFEGALRKWVLPGLSTPLLIIRDPVALWVVFKALQRGLVPKNGYLTGMVIIGFIGILTAVLFGHGNLFVAIYGARIFLVHFPLIFVIGSVFNRDDVIKVAKVTLWLTIMMTVLIALQFYSPQSAWVNRGIGGDSEGGGFNGGALGFFRPPGTFSFTNGNVLYFSYVAPFVFYFWLNTKKVNKLLLIGASIALLAAIPLSISRSLFFQVAISLIFLMLGISRKPEYLGKMIMAVIAVFVAFTILGNTQFFQTSTEAFSVRFESANESEGGLKGVLGDRFIGGMLQAFSSSSDLPFFGKGLGMGTSVGGMLLSGQPGLTITEDEWGRTVAELGPILGIAAILLRVSMFLKIALACYKKLALGDMLPWMLLSFACLNLPQGQWAQPTALGFGVVIAGLMLASLRAPAPVDNEYS